MRGLLLLAATAGCTLLFDPSGIVPAPVDASSADLHVVAPVDDLAVVDDLQLPDLATEDLLTIDLNRPDLLSPDLLPCVRPSFPGFYDGGASDPYDCAQCGCRLDPLIEPVRWNHQISTGWSETADVNGLLISAPAAAHNSFDLFQSQSHFYLEGDFDLRVDYQLAAMPDGASLLVYVLGPVVDGGTPYGPWAYDQLYQSGGRHLRVFVDDRYLDISEDLPSGTIRLRRAGASLCASVLNHEEQCHDNPFQNNRVWIQIYATVQNPGCSDVCVGAACCNFQARIGNVRLIRGTLRANP